jgi:hypothetical protein
MLILAVLLVLIVVGWVVLAPRILPPAQPPSATGLDGRWTRTPDQPLTTSLLLIGARYSIEGELSFTGSGGAGSVGNQLVVSGDTACTDAIGTYAVELGDVDRHGLLPEHRAQTVTLTLVTDACAARADVLAGTWTLRASGRDGVYGICDPPNEEAAITGHWPEPSGCS